MFSVIVMMTHAQMINDGEGDRRGGGEWCAIFLLCNEPISVKCLASFLLLTKQTLVYTHS